MATENPVADQGTIRENKLDLVERLADDLAHEIKNPLHSMVINLEVLRRRIARLDPQPTEDLLRYASVLSSELERVNRRIDLLLRMVRPSRDSEDLASIAEVVEELRELLELESQRHGVQLNVEEPRSIALPDLPRAATRQMLLSLILETLDRTPEGGVLQLNTVENGTDLYVEVTTSAFTLEELRTEDNSYLPVARSLAEKLGGHLDEIGPSDSPSGTAQNGQVGYVLTLPKKR